ncbi:hypothetical protein ACS0TY_001527 [Phlomoides rotata]
MNRYRLTYHKYMIRFTRATNMEEVEEENYAISLEKFRFRSYSELLQLADKNEDLPDVIGFLCSFDKTFGGKLCLNASSGTKFYLNADFATVRDFRGRMKFQPLFDDSYKKLESKGSETQLHSIAQILSFISNEKQQVKEFSCKAKVTEIILRNGWNYISCSSCARKVEKTQTTITCNNCHDPKVVGILG